MKKILATLGLFCIAMAVYATTNEISILQNLDVSKNSLQMSKSSGQQAVQMAGTRFYSAVYALTTTNQVMAKGAIGDLGWSYSRNLSSNATVAISYDNGATTNEYLLPGEARMIRFAPGYIITQMVVAVTSGTGDFENTILEK